MSHDNHGLPASDDHRGLSTLLAILEAHGVAHWVDSGVLLALHRDGELNPWEKDIDLAVLADEIPSLLECSGDLESAGYEVSQNRYRGHLYALGAKPSQQARPHSLRAAIHVYYEAGDYLWSPQAQIYIPPPSPDVFSGRRSFPGYLAKRAIDRWLYQSPQAASAGRGARAPDRVSPLYRLSRAIYRRADRGRLAETWPISEIFVPLTWVVPRELVLPLTSINVNGATLPVPGDVEGYLTYRYGEWRTPVPEWCYWEDDGAIIRRRPGDVVPSLRAKRARYPF